MTDTVSPALLTKREVAKKLRKTERTVNSMMAARAIEFVKVGRSVRFTPEAVERFLKSHTVNAA